MSQLRALSAVPWATFACGAAARFLPDVSPRRWVSSVILAVTWLLLVGIFYRWVSWPKHAAWMGVVLGWLTAMPVGLWLWLDPFGPRRLYDPADCVVPMSLTESCKGTDDSFTERRYRFRAEGRPQAARCHAFMAALAEDEPFEKKCDFASPTGWRRVPCASRGLPSTMTCFACDSRETERSLSLVDGFSTACEREIVLAACNMPLP